MQQRGSCEAILREPSGTDGITGCGGWAKREDKVGAWLVRYLMSEQKRERCRDTATRAKTKFYSYSRTRTTRIHKCGDPLASLLENIQVTLSR